MLDDPEATIHFYSQKDRYNNNCLHYAAQGDSVEILDIIVDKMKNREEKDKLLV